MYTPNSPALRDQTLTSIQWQTC